MCVCVCVCINMCETYYVWYILVNCVAQIIVGVAKVSSEKQGSTQRLHTLLIQGLCLLVT